MINKIIAWIVGSKIGGAFTAVHKFIDGKKTYALGAVPFVQGIVGLWVKVAACPDLAGFIKLASNIKSDTDYQMVLAGLALWFLKSAAKKAEPLGGAPGSR